MKFVLYIFNQVECNFIKLMDKFSHNVLRFNIGFIYFMFGVLKFFPNSSPAEQLAISTLDKISYGFISGHSALILLAVIETGIGICILLNYQLRWVIYIALAHMIGTFLPLFLFPEQAFSDFPVSISLMGQYIIKNLVIVSSLLVLYSKLSVRQGNVVLMRVNKEDVPQDNEDLNYEIPERSETLQHKLSALRK